MIKLENGLAARVTHLRTLKTGPNEEDVTFGPRRYVKGESPLDKEPTCTIVEIYDGDKIVATGEASTKKEQFNRSKGRRIALNRALKVLENN